MVYMVPKRNSVLAPHSAKTELILAPYGAKNGITFWHHMVPHGASWCQKVPKRGTPHFSCSYFYLILMQNSHDIMQFSD